MVEVGHFIDLVARFSALAATYSAIGACATNAQVISGLVVERNRTGEIATNKLPKNEVHGVSGNLFGN
jgi:hypothetical protein